ncbi:MAG: hypothetical protein EKK40_03865 [Bradyrhizobiaceae bacterium]|nr:MAG: hypothetical protein EKK40_03865 [Bradyrhizobiaceae bacterium]
MSIKTRLAAAAFAALTLTGGAIATTSPAQAGHYNGAAIGLGIASGVVLGAAIAGNSYGPPAYAYGYRRCGWVRQFDAYGNYIGRVRSCAY